MNNKELRQAIENIIALPEEVKPVKGELFGKQVAAVDKTAKFVRENFKVIIDALREIKPSQLDDTAKESLQAAMIKVGEVDRMTSLFNQLKEFDELKGVYKKLIGKKTRRLTSTRIEEPWEKDEVFPVDNDVKKVKQDMDYELFYMKKEDGTVFFNPSLAKSMPLSGHGILDEFSGEDPFLQIKSLLDRRFQMLAEEMVKRLKPSITNFLTDYKKYEFNQIVPLISKASMALMLAANSKNLLRNFPVKSSHHYFADFHTYLREIFDKLEYQALVEKEKKTRTRFDEIMLEIIHGFAAAAYTTPFLSAETGNALFRLIGKASEEKDIPSFISDSFGRLKHIFGRFPEGPLFKGFDLLMEKTHPAFDPFLLDNWPYKMFKVDLNQHPCDVIHIPSPTTQEVIHRAHIVDEFKAFLYTVEQKKGHHLLVNLQDRTAWKERARVEALEELQYDAEFNDVLTVITLPRDTDFYNQEAEYNNLNISGEFIDQFKEHLLSKECGFYYPKKIYDALFESGFADTMLQFIHTHFFSQKNVLSRRERLDFIELAYILIVEKIVELTKASSMSLTCKDGIDSGSTLAGALFAFNKLKHGSLFTEKDKDALLLMLFGPAFLLRERLVQEERVMRLLSFVKLISAHPKALKESA